MTRPVTLLVVDDDESGRSMLSRRLERSGFRVFTAGSGVEALERLPSLGADVVLLDYEMPDVNGIETLRRLRRLYGKSELAVIMVTAHNDSRVVVDTLKEGADDFVTKPIDFPVVLARIGVQVARREAEQALRDSEERYALVARATNDGFWDWRLATGDVYFSTRWTTMLGFEEDEFGSSPDAWLARVHPDDVAEVQTQLAALIEARTDTFESEHRVQHKKGHYIWVRNRALAVRDSAGRPQRIVGSQADVTEGKVADPLTGLPNRLLFMDRLTRCLYRRRRFEDFHFAVLFLDLDGFKDVNDSLGHLAGDDLLIAVGHRLENSVRATDMVGRPAKPHTVARFGGDEFTVLLEDLQKPSDALLVAERLQVGLAQAFSVAGQEVFTTASIGIVLDTDGYDRPEDLLRDADTAMYKAKASGRTQYAVFDAALRDVAVERLTLGTDLKKAMERAEFVTYYQPIVNLATGAIAGFEALVRWQHAKRGIVSPDDFISAAEGMGLIVSIGRLVLEQSCADLRRWQVRHAHAAEFVMSVNLSGKELMRADLIESVRSALEQAGLPAASVKFEITESFLMEKPDAVTERLVALRALGIQLGIDDFGTGYSSLSYLHRFPVNTLKIDRSFVSRLGPGSDGNEIVGTIVSLAHNLGLDTVAEGIETPDQLGRLRALGCEFGQGFLFAQPLTFDDAERLIAARPVWAPPSIAHSR